MKSFNWARIFGLFLLIILLSYSVLLGAGKAMIFYKQYVTQTSIVRGVQSIDSATDSIIKGVGNIAKECAVGQYELINKLSHNNKGLNLSEEELEFYYRRGYYNRIKKSLKGKNRRISEVLNGLVSDAGIDRITVTDSSELQLVSYTDESDDIKGISITGLELVYQDPIIGTRTERIDLKISIPEVVFFTGSDELFDYCMMAEKGIYITGATSSFIGDIYAGSHGRDEVRDPEIMYGEIMHYGGINILSTQLSVRAHRIVCSEDININGSFVILAPEEEELSCYAKKINDIKGFAKESLYNLEGDYYRISELNEESQQEYNECEKNARAYFARLGNIPLYYDSDNDPEYKGPYRKLIASTDVELTDDFTGVVMTPYNVIVGNDVNFEGLIICGDRIYIRGNNNIVSNREVLRSILEYEENAPDSIEAVDYLTGLIKKGITEPNYYVVPYRQN